MKSSIEILPLLLSPDCPHSRRKLVEVSYKIALTYITFNHRRVKKILISQEITPSELALEAISSLFEVDDNKRFTVINDALEKWLPPVSSEEEALFFLNKLVQKKPSNTFQSCSDRQILSFHDYSIKLTIISKKMVTERFISLAMFI